MIIRCRLQNQGHFLVVYWISADHYFSYNITRSQTIVVVLQYGKLPGNKVG